MAKPPNGSKEGSLQQSGERPSEQVKTELLHDNTMHSELSFKSLLQMRLKEDLAKLLPIVKMPINKKNTKAKL